MATHQISDKHATPDGTSMIEFLQKYPTQGPQPIEAVTEEARAARWKEIVAEMKTDEERMRQGMVAAGTSVAADRAAIEAAPEREVKVEGNVHPADLARHKAKYGKRLASIIETDPNDMQHGIDTQGSIYQALWAEFKRQDITIEFDASLIGLYHANVSSLSPFPFDPRLSYVTFRLGDGITPALEKELRKRFTLSDDHVAHMHALFAQFKADELTKYPGVKEAELADLKMRFFMQISAQYIHIVEAYDSTAKTTVFATGVALPIGEGAHVISDAVFNCTKHVLRAFITKDTKRAEHIGGIRIAWYQHPSTAVLGIYVTEQDRDPYAKEKETHLSAVDAAMAKVRADAEAALSKALDDTHLFDEPDVDAATALATIASAADKILSAVPAAAAMLMQNVAARPSSSLYDALNADNTAKPKNGDVMPF